jgi:hypothetical protein
MALKRVLTSVNASITMLGLSSASSLRSMACMLNTDVVSVLKLAEARKVDGDMADTVCVIIADRSEEQD